MGLRMAWFIEAAEQDLKRFVRGSVETTVLAGYWATAALRHPTLLVQELCWNGLCQASDNIGRGLILSR